MRKKILSTLLALTITAVTFAGCNTANKNNIDKKDKIVNEKDTIKQTDNKSNTNESLQTSKVNTEVNSKDGNSKYEHTFQDIGLQYNDPAEWGDNDQIGPSVLIRGKINKDYILGHIPFSFIPKTLVEQLKTVDQTDKEKIEKLSKEYQLKEISNLGVVLILQKDLKNKASKSDLEKIDNLTKGFSNKEKIVENDNLECIIFYNDKYDTAAKKYTEDEQKEFDKAVEGFKKLKDYVNLIKPYDTETAIKEFNSEVSFKTKTLDNKDIDSNIIKGKKLTMLNIWATHCGPCIEEMPGLQKLYEKYAKDDFNIIGIVQDAYNDEELQAVAQKIVKDQGVKYTNIIPDEKLQKGILADVVGTPTTIFLDSNGNVVGEPILSSLSFEDYDKNVQERFDMIKNK